MSFESVVTALFVFALPWAAPDILMYLFERLLFVFDLLFHVTEGSVVQSSGLRWYCWL